MLPITTSQISLLFSGLALLLSTRSLLYYPSLNEYHHARALSVKEWTVPTSSSSSSSSVIVAHIHNMHNNNSTSTTATNETDTFIATTPTMTTNITIVVGHCKEKLNHLEFFESCHPSPHHHLQFVIMSKCNATVPTLNKIAECVTVQRIDNCGNEEYAYLQYVQHNYDTLPSMVAFIQGSGLTENPHLVHDILHTIPGTYYADLSRYVTTAWHMGVDPVRSSMIQKVAPQLMNESGWLASWRTQFMVSRAALQRFPRALYQEFSQTLCSHTCVDFNCGTEVWFSSMFGCTDVMFRDGSDCQPNVEHHLSPKVIQRDYYKDSVSSVHEDETLAWSTIQTTCGNRTLLQARSKVNGRLVCVEGNPTGISNSNQWWREAIYQMYAEDKQPLLFDLEWRFERIVEKKVLIHPAWRNRKAEKPERNSTTTSNATR